jgi:proline iminopeptidase
MLANGDHLVEANGAVQWLGVRGAGLGTVPLLVLHGGPGANNWIFEQCVAQGIASRRTLVLHEQRGCGRSGPGAGVDHSSEALIADIGAVIDLLGVRQVDLLGWSFGGHLAVRVTVEQPARVRRLILQAPALDFTTDAVAEYLLRSYLELASPEVRDEVARVVGGAGTPWERVLRLLPLLDPATFDRVGYHQSEKAARADRLYERFGVGTNMDMLTALMTDTAGEPVVPRLGAIQQSALVITGAHDHNVDPERTEAVARAIPRARLVRFANSAHMPDLEEPELYVDTVLDFLDRPTDPDDPISL